MFQMIILCWCVVLEAKNVCAVRHGAEREYLRVSCQSTYEDLGQRNLKLRDGRDGEDEKKCKRAVREG